MEKPTISIRDLSPVLTISTEKHQFHDGSHCIYWKDDKIPNRMYIYSRGTGETTIHDIPDGFRVLGYKPTSEHHKRIYIPEKRLCVTLPDEPELIDMESTADYITGYTEDEQFTVYDIAEELFYSDDYGRILQGSEWYIYGSNIYYYDDEHILYKVNIVTDEEIALYELFGGVYDDEVCFFHVGEILYFGNLEDEYFYYDMKNEKVMRKKSEERDIIPVYSTYLCDFLEFSGGSFCLNNKEIIDIGKLQWDSTGIIGRFIECYDSKEKTYYLYDLSGISGGKSIPAYSSENSIIPLHEEVKLLRVDREKNEIYFYEEVLPDFPRQLSDYHKLGQKSQKTIKVMFTLRVIPDNIVRVLPREILKYIFEIYF